ncbi:MAG: signal peptidase II [Candidatus Omnitrophica bacterium]|nr:signal peptidase II [Candidatus Omnitrophota bacterium]
MWLFWIVILFSIVGDQLTKLAASLFLEEGASMTLVPRIFHLTLVHNQGIAFGLFNNHGSLLLVFIAASVLILLIFSFQSMMNDRYHQMVYGLIIGGAIGNLIDRFRLGYVVDFLDFRIWPVFNLADTWITVGVLLFAFSAFQKKHHAP